MMVYCNEKWEDKCQGAVRIWGSGYNCVWTAPRAKYKYNIRQD